MSTRKRIGLFSILLFIVFVLVSRAEVMAQDRCQAGNYIVSIVEPFPLYLKAAQGIYTCPSSLGYPCMLFRYSISGDDISKVTHLMSLVPVCRRNQIEIGVANMWDVCRGDPNTGFGENVCNAFVVDYNPTASPNNTEYALATSPTKVGLTALAVAYGGRGGATFGCASPVGGPFSSGILGPVCEESNTTVVSQVVRDSNGATVCIQGEVVVDCATGEILPWVDIASITIGDGNGTFVEAVGDQGWVVLSNDAVNTTYYCNPYTGRCYPIR